MWTGKQFSGTLKPHETQYCFTWGWPPEWHVVWYMMPTSPQIGAAQVDWDVAVERANATQCTYWLTVKNLTGATVNYDGRFAVLS